MSGQPHYERYQRQCTAAAGSSPAPLSLPSEPHIEGPYSGDFGNPSEEALAAVRRAIGVVDSLATLCASSPCVGGEVNVCNDQVAEKVACLQIILSAVVSVADSQWVDLESAVHRRVRFLGLHGEVTDCTTPNPPKKSSTPSGGRAPPSRNRTRGIIWNDETLMEEPPTARDEGFGEAKGKDGYPAAGPETNKGRLTTNIEHSDGATSGLMSGRRIGEETGRPLTCGDEMALSKGHDTNGKVSASEAVDNLKVPEAAESDTQTELVDSPPCLDVQQGGCKGQREPIHCSEELPADGTTFSLCSTAGEMALHENGRGGDRTDSSDVGRSADYSNSKNVHRYHNGEVGDLQCWWGKQREQPRGEVLNGPRLPTDKLEASLHEPSPNAAAEDTVESLFRTEDGVVSISGTDFCSKEERSMHDVEEAPHSHVSVSATVTPVTPVLGKEVSSSPVTRGDLVDESEGELKAPSQLIEMVDVGCAKSPMLTGQKDDGPLNRSMLSKITALPPTTRQCAGAINADHAGLKSSTLQDSYAGAASRTYCPLAAGVSTIVTDDDIGTCGGSTLTEATGASAGPASVSKQSGESTTSHPWEAHTAPPISVGGSTQRGREGRGQSGPADDADDKSGNRGREQPPSSCSAAPLPPTYARLFPASGELTEHPFEGGTCKATSEVTAAFQPQPLLHKTEDTHAPAFSTNVAGARGSRTLTGLSGSVPNYAQDTGGEEPDALGGDRASHAAPGAGEARLIPYGLLLLRQVLQEAAVHRSRRHGVSDPM
ncbi:hypothetical protein, conserved [Trypanosoma brucei gambiense DAL972]|uniref:Uncharacterized protein n=1 Tax=Trypanosoma brucei gambiense (strain MHOM/CI/86/DAL972) TaxID=679716 RepID=C9ZJ26_TRYB9|nr:hypothetical protein, conserved [Trypanosoma brucei gambiense DAL972]CBH09384.1 hypothetical protein, conserved [Trypanosoma brucei gambiense DAL972]|eukprot:XP_011771690.1 hypothetical protein, conserved [Trypanosoma brucei gambiense DAL972]